MGDPKTPLSAIAAVQDPDDLARWIALPGPGIAESDTEGRRWNRFATRPLFAAVTGLTILSATPQAPRTIFASGWNEYLHHIQAPSVMRSENEGRTWIYIFDLNNLECPNLAAVTTPAAPDTLIVPNVNGELKISHNRGATWSASSIYPSGQFRGLTAVAADPKVANRLLALGSDPDDRDVAVSVRRSPKGGTTWSKSDRGLPAPIKLRTRLRPRT